MEMQILNEKTMNYFVYKEENRKQKDNKINTKIILNRTKK